MKTFGFVVIRGQDTTVDLHGLESGTYPEGVEPIVNTQYRRLF